MLRLPASVRIFVCLEPADMRRSFDGLSGMVQSILQQSPTCGHLFVFRNRRSDLVKVLFYDPLGCCLLAKRLYKGTFRIAMAPDEDRVSIEITQADLASLLSRAEIVTRVAHAA